MVVGEDRLRGPVRAGTLHRVEEEIARKLAEHDKRFDEHDRRFDEHDRRFDEHDRRFDRIEAKLEEHDEKFHRMGIQLEKIGDDVRLVLEVVQTGFESLRRDLQTQIDEIKARLDRLEHVVAQNSRDIAFLMSAVQEHSRQIAENTRAIEELREAIGRIEAKLDKKEDRERVDAIEQRVAVLEAEILGTGEVSET